MIQGMIGFQIQFAQFAVNRIGGLRISQVAFKNRGGLMAGHEITIRNQTGHPPPLVANTNNFPPLHCGQEFWEISG